MLQTGIFERGRMGKNIYLTFIGRLISEVRKIKQEEVAKFPVVEYKFH